MEILYGKIKKLNTIKNLNQTNICDMFRTPLRPEKRDSLLIIAWLLGFVIFLILTQPMNMCWNILSILSAT